MNNLSLHEIETFYKAHRQAIKTHCRVNQIPIYDIEMFVDSINPEKVTYRYNDKVIMTAEAKPDIKIKIRRTK